MKNIQKVELIKIILYAFCILLGGILTFYSNLKGVWILEIILITAGLYFCFHWKIIFKRAVIIGLAVVLVILSLLYNVRYLYPYLKGANSTINLVNTQISIPQNSYNQDMWIYPIISHKNVNIYYADKWCWNYIKAFSESTSDEKLEGKNKNISLTEKVKNNYFQLVGYTTFFGLSPLFSEKDINKISKQKMPPNLYVATDGLLKEKEVVVLTDNEYGIYIMSIKIFHNIVGDMNK